MVFSGYSTYIYWGESSCANGTTLVYSGTVAAVANPVCLVGEGERETLQTGSQAEHTELTITTVECARCLIQQPTTFTIAGTTSCPEGWTHIYNGYLATVDGTTICVDWPQESLDSDIYPFELVSVSNDTPEDTPTPPGRRQATVPTATIATEDPQSGSPLACAVCGGPL